MSRRNLAAPGLSYVDANRGRVVEFDDEVTGIKRRIEETWPELRVLWDKDDELWLIIEHCKDGTDRLAFQTKKLNDQVLDRIQKADTHRAGQEDPLALLDMENERIEAELDKEFAEKIYDAGERLAHAFAQDGLTVRPRSVPLSVKLKKRRALPNHEVPNRAGIRR